MAQAGIHGLVGTAVRKLTPVRVWLMLGIVLGNLVPDLDNLAVALATVIKLPTEGLHRSFTHSLFAIMSVMVIFYFVGYFTRQPCWINLGIGLGVGILMHILLDLLLWFDGVELLWPIPLWVNPWGSISPPPWFDKLMMSSEFLFFALFLLGLASLAKKHGTDREYLGMLRTWTWIEMGLFVVFTILVYSLQKGFMMPYGAVYLLSLGLAIGVTIRMRNSVEAVAV